MILTFDFIDHDFYSQFRKLFGKEPRDVRSSYLLSRQQSQLELGWQALACIASGALSQHYRRRALQVRTQTQLTARSLRRLWVLTASQKESAGAPGVPIGLAFYVVK